MKKSKKYILIFLSLSFCFLFFNNTNVLAQDNLNLPEGKSEDYPGDLHPHSLLSAGGIQGESLRVCVSMGCCSICDVMTVISKAFKILRNDIALPLAIIFGIIGGIMIIFSAGSPNKVKSGKTYITSALIGLLIIFGASLIVNTVTIAIAGSSWSFNSVMNGVITNVSSDGCKKSCTPGVDPEIKTITGTVVDLDKNIKFIIDDLSSKYANKGFRVTSTTDGQHVAGSCHYNGRAVDFVTNNKAEWQDIVNYLNRLPIPNISAFCDYNGDIRDCQKEFSNHIHVQVGPCSSPPNF